MKNYWWKILGIVMVLYAIIRGLLMDVPALPILNETIRNLYYHVTMWFGMMILLTISVIFSIKYLSSNNQKHDTVAIESANTGMLLGLLGLFTGMIWANFTWGAPWVNDPKLNGSAITLLIYFAYFILRSSLDEEQKKAKISAVYNIFAYVMLIVFLMILPRMTDSLHPGNGGNPAFSTYDLDEKMRWVFYPAIIGWTLIGVWMMQVRIRIKNIEYDN
jgi:heme exporter protein C